MKQIISVNGLTSDETRQVSDLIIKANTEQIKAMLAMLQGELKKREFTQGGKQ